MEEKPIDGEIVGNGLFKRSLETDQLIGRLRKATPENPMVSYSELNAIIRGDVQKTHHGRLVQARRRLQADFSMEFITIPSEGVKLATASERLSKGMDVIPAIHRVANRGAKTLGTTNLSELTNDEKIKFNATASMVGVMLHATKATSVKRIEQAAGKAQDRLNIGTVLEQLRQ